MFEETEKLGKPGSLTRAKELSARWVAGASDFARLVGNRECSELAPYGSCYSSFGLAIVVVITIGHDQKASCPCQDKPFRNSFRYFIMLG